MRVISMSVAIALLLVASAAFAQEWTPSDADLRAIRSALLKAEPVVFTSLVFTNTTSIPDLNRPTTLGLLTLVPPGTPGEGAIFTIPIGEYVMRTLRSASKAWQQHRERLIVKRAEQERCQSIVCR